MESQALPTAMPARSPRRITLLAVLALVLGSGFVWMAADQVIAPPLTRIMDLLWRLFVCDCFFQFNVI